MFPGNISSLQIAIARVICIFFMMYVHVNPGYSNPSILSSEPFHIVGETLITWLGRSSVAALSFFSGYLMFGIIQRRSLPNFINTRLKTIILPMLVWNLIYITSKQLGTITDHSINIDFSLANLIHWVFSDATGIYGPTSNLSLFFLRDLFFSGILAFLIFPVLRRYPALVLLGALLVALLDISQPIIFRPTITLFLLSGLTVATFGLDISKISNSRSLMPTAIALLSFYAIQSSINYQVYNYTNLEQYTPNLLPNLENITKRAILVVGVLLVTRWIASTQFARQFVSIEKWIFVTYLVHLPLFGTIWLIWTSTIGDEHRLSYIVFFIFAPVFALLFGKIFDSLITSSPSSVQIALKGKSAK